MSITIQLDAINRGTTNSTGALVLKTSGGTTLCTNLFSATAFGAASGGTRTSNAIATAVAVATGTAAVCEWQDRDRNLVASITVSTTNADGATLTMSSLSITSGQTVNYNPIVYTLP